MYEWRFATYFSKSYADHKILSYITVSWQKGLVEREINSILRGLTQQMRKKVPTAVSRWRRPLSSDSDAREVLPQRDIAEDDVCPICQDELLLKRLPVTYCKYVFTVG